MEEEKPLILVADDDAAVAGVVRLHLERRGYAVEIVGDGEQTLARIDRGLPDLLILDIAMPKLDGFTVVTRLRDDPRTSGLSVVILTARGQMQSFLRQHPNVKAFIDKPFKAAQLIEIVDGLVARRA